jgi:alkaline phosphatase
LLAALLPNDAAHLERQLWQQAQAAQQQQPQQLVSRSRHPKKQRSDAAAAAAAAAEGQPRLNNNVIGVKHLEPRDIQQVVWWLSQSQGRAKTSRIPTKHIVSKQPSIQGVWTASTFAAQQ